MLETLQQFGKDIARGWESLAEGWRELLSRSANALTRFTRKEPEQPSGQLTPAEGPRWSLLAGDVVDIGKEIVVRVELPGVDKSDCEITIEANALYVRGEKRHDASYFTGAYHVRQCAYGVFERAVPLPHNVQADRAAAQFRNGVLVVRLPKGPEERPKRITIH